MPKLTFPISEIETKTNKVTTSSTPSSSWTDLQYPTAKALYSTYSKILDVVHPVGSVICMSTNTNPGSTLGGTWTLVDKSFKQKWIAVTDGNGWTATSASAHSSFAVILHGHTVYIRAYVTTTAALSDSTINLGTMPPNYFGLSSWNYLPYMPFSYDGGGVKDVVGNIVFTAEGVLQVTDIWNADNTHSYAAGSNLTFHITHVVMTDQMLDSACDKFYFKRTA